MIQNYNEPKNLSLYIPRVQYIFQLLNCPPRHGVNHVLWSRKLAAEARRWGIRLSVLNKDHHSKSNIIVSIKNHVSYGELNTLFIGDIGVKAVGLQNI